MSFRVKQFDRTGANVYLDRLFVENVFNTICNDFSFQPGMLSFTLVSDDELLEINNQYLNHNYYTDIITFGHPINGIVLGEIFVSLDRARENAETFQVDFFHELSRLFIHGVCHLCGQNDYLDDERKQMQSLEDKYLTLHFVSRGTI